MPPFSSETFPTDDELPKPLYQPQPLNFGAILETLLDNLLHNRTNPDECDRVITNTLTNESEADQLQELRILWRNVMLLICLHIASIYGIYLMFTVAMWQTNLFACVLNIVSLLGVTAGAHRLWAHRSYKAKLPLRVSLAFFFTLAFQDNIYMWASNHRLHHKYSETNADPHNIKRGFFFAHVGWLLYQNHPKVLEKRATTNFMDLLEDPVVYYNRKYYIFVALICCFILPTVVPMYLWGETFLNAFFIAVVFRYCFTLHQTWSMNSVAHTWGQRWYNLNISPRDNTIVALGAMGEGFLNFHHTFPYDYATSEHGMKYNLTTAFINVMARLGQAYERKTTFYMLINAKKYTTAREKFAKEH